MKLNLTFVLGLIFYPTIMLANPFQRSRNIQTPSPEHSLVLNNIKPIESNISFGSPIDSSSVINLLVASIPKLLNTFIWYLQVRQVLSALHAITDKTLSQFKLGIFEDELPDPLLSLYMKPNTTLTKYELEILSGVRLPGNCDQAVLWDSVVGLENVKIDLWECVQTLSTTKNADKAGKQAQSWISSPVRGVLLFGPPGCGKSFIVSSLAQKSNIPIISITPSLIQRKFFGETQHIVKAIFTLAAKIQPCFIYIDEIDALMGSRYDTEQSTDRSIKTEFMTLWDSLVDKGQNVLVVGATNMPQLLDPAIQRRFERSFLIGLPNKRARRKMLKLFLQDKCCSNFDFSHIASLTQGYSPSDLLSLCKASLSISMRNERNNKISTNSYQDSNDTQHELIDVVDFEEAMQSIFPTQWTARSYGMMQKSMSQPHSEPYFEAEGRSDDDDDDDDET